MKLITSHINADFDALASMMAAKRIYPDAEMVFPGSQERKVRDFIEVFHPADFRRLRDIDFSTVTQLIIVDAKHADRLGPLSTLLSQKGIKIHIYDHHPFEENDIRRDQEMIEEVGATATLFTELLRDRKLHPTPMEATILTLGIYEETGSLLFPSTTTRDLLAVAYLLKRGANLNIVSSYIKMDLNRQELDLLNELLASSAEVVLRGLRVMIAKASRDSYVGDAAHLAHKIMEMEDVDAVVILLEMQGKILLVARSRARELDVAELMKEFGGGGHPTAASATIKEASLEMAADKLKILLDKHIKHGKVAVDVMTSPVITTQWDSAIKEAADTMTRYGVNVLPIIRDEKYVGLISREIVEKALFHGFKRNKCIEFSTSDAATVGKDTPVRDIEAIMIEQNQRFMPVIEEGNIIGAITRTDLLRVIYEDFLRKRRLDKEGTHERSPTGRNLSTLLRDRFPDEVHRILVLAGNVADDMGANAYLVGGSVRDLLLGHANLDIDIVIEGDGIRFAKELGEKLKAQVRSHHRFGTANITLDKLKLDVATARTEYYESPAALPKVEMSSIKKDLYRRDFTINTLAIKLNARSFGLLIDFFGGQRDLREKTIRVLHNLSYVEDPTRAFRAVRFAERFGFKLSRHSENLIKSAIQMNLFERLSGSRLFDELLIAFSETNPVKTLKRLSDYGLLKIIHKNLVLDEKLESTLSSMYETLAWHTLLFLDEKVDKGVLYLIALLSNLDDEQRAEALHRLAPPGATREIIQQSIAESAEILGKLPLNDPVGIYHLLSPKRVELILFSMAITKDNRKKKEISQFLVELRKTKPFLTGRDLKKLGLPEGPLYSRIFRELLDKRLRGTMRTAEDEKKYVTDHYMKG
ncbi:PolyA polymerase family protein [Candidatus Sulfobium mesophilum]|uniref:PolyA polymerase family protein n=1 Tax=Candidatus Sulfobium mesophilum TaxID=2016548 RepID=A0A2U3QDQ5_9BACT|nr:PolyA polymerase family protein [Candidatus Sulfobium mesophilum]